MKFKYTKAEQLYIKTVYKTKTVQQMADELGLTVKKVQAFVDTLEPVQKPAPSTESGPKKAGFTTDGKGAFMMNGERSAKDDEINQRGMTRQEYLNSHKNSIHVINPDLPTN